ITWKDKQMIDLNEIKELAEEYGAERIIQDVTIDVIFLVAPNKYANYEAGKFCDELRSKKYDCFIDYRGKRSTKLFEVVRIRR
ncbi:MAG: hypothetical protein PUP91_28380, partial [Rhizonema sp. PD37]|nr:hypothetical protein [Rhizonema sp. PD37]